MTPINLAFLGCGHAARLHSRVLQGMWRNVRRFYASRTPAKAARYDARLLGDGAFRGYEDAIDSDHIDAVMITLPPAEHFQWAQRALAAGKHVIVEKPAFLCSADFEPIERAATAAGCQVFVAENYFYKPLARRLRASLGAGVIGDVRLLLVDARKHQRVRGWRALRETAGGGALFEGGIHWVNLMANWGPPVGAVTAERLGPQEGPERDMVVHFEYQGGARGVLRHSWVSRSPLGPLRLSKVEGSAGSIRFESNGLFMILGGSRTRVWGPDWRDLAGYRAMFRDYVDAIASGRPPAFDLRRARRDVELVEEAYRTAGEPPPGRPA